MVLSGCVLESLQVLQLSAGLAASYPQLQSLRLAVQSQQAVRPECKGLAWWSEVAAALLWQRALLLAQES